jgi:small conductance mechanosensitive channel
MNPEKLYDKGYTWLLEKGPSVITAIILLFIGLWFIKFIRRLLVSGMRRRELDPSLQPFLQSLIIISLQVLLIIGIMQIVGLELTIFTTIIGAFGVAAGLALSGTLQNFASGVLILLLKPFRVNDAILAQGQEGIVSSIQIFYTVMTTYDNKTVIIPNSKLSNEVITNISRQGKRRLDIEMKFNYGTDIAEIKTIIDQLIASSKNINKSPSSRIGVSVLEPDGYKIMINLWVNAREFQETKLELQEKLINSIKNAGIKLPGM